MTRNMTAKKADAEAWDQHWQAGHLSSLSQDNQDFESGEAVAAWAGFFKTLKNGAKILDICTGNGIVPALANKYAVEAGVAFAITGVDQASIDPHSTVGGEMLQGVTFKGGVSAEALPFPDGEFDAVTGQYALEYTDAAKTIPEVARVLQKGGRVRFVIHATGGVIVGFNAPKARQAAWLVSESGVFEALLEAARAGFAGEDAEARRKTFRDCAVKARETLSGMGENPELQTLLQNLVQGYITRDRFADFSEFSTWLEGVEAEVSGQINMMRALEAAARDQAGIDAMAAKFEGAGFKNLKVSKLRAGGHMLAWTLEGLKA